MVTQIPIAMLMSIPVCGCKKGHIFVSKCSSAVRDGVPDPMSRGAGVVSIWSIIFYRHTNVLVIGHVNEYPTMHYFETPRHTQPMIEYNILTEYFWKFQ